MKTLLAIILFSVSLKGQNSPSSSDHKNKYHTNIEEASKWLNEIFSMNSFEENDTIIEYNFGEVRKINLSGFMLCGLKKLKVKSKSEEETFFYIVLDDVTRFGFDDLNIFSVECSDDSNGIMLLIGEKFYKTYKLEFRLNSISEIVRIRISNAFKDIVNNNILETEKNEKYYTTEKP